MGFNIDVVNTFRSFVELLRLNGIIFHSDQLNVNIANSTDCTHLLHFPSNMRSNIYRNWQLTASNCLFGFQPNFLWYLTMASISKIPFWNYISLEIYRNYSAYLHFHRPNECAFSSKPSKTNAFKPNRTINSMHKFKCDFDGIPLNDAFKSKNLDINIDVDLIF